MRNDRGESSRHRTVLTVVVAIACLGVALACACGCLLAVFTANLIEETEYPILVDTVISIDTSVLPENATEKDWYPIALQVLEDSGWELPPNLVMLSSGIPCSPPAELERLHLDFAATDLVGFLPHYIGAQLYLDRRTGTAKVMIWDGGPRLAHSRTLELSEMTVDLRKALEIADANGGQEVRRQVDKSCEASIWIREHTWEIHYYYREPEQSARTLLYVEVDARTGKAKRLP